MSSELSSPAEPSAEPPLLTNHEDYLLQQLVEFANAGAFSAGITLQMGGFLVTGTLIAADTYFDKFADLVVNGASEGSTGLELVRTALASFGDRYREARLDDGPALTGNTAYIHLENCTFYTPSGSFSFKALWRGRIAQADGFFLGLLSH